MSHCFDINPQIVIKKTNEPDKLYHDRLSLILASITKQLICNTSGNIIDIGAYNGKWTDYVNNNNPDLNRRILLFEPSPVEYVYLLHKYKTCKRITVNNLAIGAHRGYVHFTDAGPDSTCLNISDTEAPVTTYDSLFKDRKMGIVKIRVNGYETYVLSGMQESMQNNNIQSLIFDFCPIDGGYRDGQLLIQKYLIALLERFAYVHIIVRDNMSIKYITCTTDVFDFMEKCDINDTYDCICSNVCLKFNSDAF